MGKTYAICIGTRPEIIKVAPVVRSLKERGANVVVVHTGQHGEIAHVLYKFFGIVPAFSLDLKRKSTSIAALTSSLIECVDQVMHDVPADVMLVQGDTTSALVGALIGYYRNIPVGHIEAGLRTGEREPFPEEKNRELIGRLAKWHFTATEQATRNLLSEGIRENAIHEVGNTVIDAAFVTKQIIRDGYLVEVPLAVNHFLEFHSDKKLILVTAHRRENWGKPIQDIASAVGNILRANEDAMAVWPLHPNPQVRDDVETVVAQFDANIKARFLLTEPFDYPLMVRILADCAFTITDSGGIQEEASAFSKPVLITRTSTERQELVEAGGAILVGTDPEKIFDNALKLLGNADFYHGMQVESSPFGDGRAADRIAGILTEAVG
jgi:UDP-N-acetylglucosamine 2-epimerase